MNIETFFSGDCDFDLLLVTIVFVEAAAVTLDKVKLELDMIASTNFVSVLPLSFVNEIESPTFNSSVNLVLIPCTSADPEPTSIDPVNTKLSPYVASNAVSAVNVGDPAIATCLTDGKSNDVTPFKPTASD